MNDLNVVGVILETMALLTLVYGHYVDRKKVRAIGYVFFESSCSTPASISESGISNTLEIL